MNIIDLRSDTVTHPTANMREAMFNAQVGDDVYGDDPTVNALEEYAANLVGKEAALFVPSGTFGNQLAIFTHCKSGNEVILGEDCHIVQHEVGAAAVISRVQLRPIQSDNGELDPREIEKRIRKEDDDIHYPSTGLICMENAHSNGRVISLNTMMKIYITANKYEVPVHLDGARLFNAAAYLDVEPKSITKYCDSVMFCLSKGLCAPVGSILAGKKEFIDKARKARKLLGGGLRQSGFLAAAGLVSLKEMIPQLKIDHENALYLAKQLEAIEGITVCKDFLHINMVFFTMDSSKYNNSKFVDEMYKAGIKINPMEDGLMRFVTHYWIKKDEIDYIIKCIKQLSK